ncbi:MAG: hypothetical protein JWO89_3682 [Verrucomicrobiaceae bacterium]|nr:hypothetical protein [Verrucomicrobiaceae bacterium]
MQKVFRALAIGVALCSTVKADEVEDGVNSALKSYKEGKPADAANALQNVLKLLNSKTGGALAAALPDHIGGWRGGKVETQSLSGTGGGSTTSRTYRQGSKEKGDEKKISVSIASDSPLLGTITTFLKAPALGQLLGAKPKEVGPYPAMFISKEGILQFAVNDRYAVLIQGKKLGESEIMEVATGLKLGILKDIH